MKMKIPVLMIIFLPCFAAQGMYRNLYMPAAAAAYSDNPSECWSNITKIYGGMDFSIYRQYTVRCESLNDTCFAYIGIDTNSAPSIYVAFRGTSNIYQFLENGWDYDEMVPFVAGGKVSKYFFDGFNDIWNAGMKDDLLALKNKYSSIDLNLIFLGHSTGGAMASLAAATFQKLVGYFPWTNLFTYGQPRTGDKDFANAVDALHNFGLVPMRFIHKADIVPHLPSLNNSNNYYHFGTEFWYNNDMGIDDDYVNCPNGDEDPTCSNSLSDFDYNIEDHKYYYDRDFIDFGVNGCPDLDPIP